MLIGTHMLIARKILKNMTQNKKDMLSNLNFIYGSIKPDILSKYKFKKHYAKESYTMIMNKIISLSSLTMDDIKKEVAIIKFSQELGVICHFLCDFFCTAHSELWRKKYKIFTHMKYEKKLASKARKFNFNLKDTILKINDDIRLFIEGCFKEYGKAISHDNDIKFAYYVCINIVNYILESIIKNSFQIKCLLIE